jgi:uncharacterized protein with HEPN domain
LTRSWRGAALPTDWALAVANRNFIIHQYDEINRSITWQTLAVDLPEWKGSLETLIAEARTALAAESARQPE